MTIARDKLILWGILIALVAGVFIGWFFPESAQNLSFLGSLFFNALYLIIVPLIVASMIVGITALGDIRKLGRTAKLAILYFTATSAVAVIIGIVLAVTFQPGVTGQVAQVAASGGEIGASGMLTKIGSALVRTLNEMIPRNIIAAAAETKVLALIVFSLFFGGILSSMGPRAKPVITFFEVVNDAVMKLVHLVMYLAPFGVLGIVASKVGEKAGDISDAAVGIGMFSLVVILGLLIHAGLLTLALKYFTGRNPFTYLANMGQALTTALGVSSSSATLPVTMECVVEKNNVDQRAASFVLPLGTTINMDGTAMYQAVSAIFICQMFGIHLGFEQYVIMFITAILASVGTPGLPQAGIVMMTMVMSSIGVPTETIGQGIGIILVVDWALDRGRTALNIYGDSIGAAVIANTFEFKTAVVPRKTTGKRDNGKSRSRRDRSSSTHGKSARGNRQSGGKSSRSSQRSSYRTGYTERPAPEEFGGASAGKSSSWSGAEPEKTAPKASTKRSAEKTKRPERKTQSAPRTPVDIETERELFASMVSAPVFDLSAFLSAENESGAMGQGPGQGQRQKQETNAGAEEFQDTTMDVSGALSQTERASYVADAADDLSLAESPDTETERAAETSAVELDADVTEVIETEMEVAQVEHSDREDDSHSESDESVEDKTSPDDTPVANDSSDSPTDESADNTVRFGRSPRRG